jgi:hypothetical protein
MASAVSSNPRFQPRYECPHIQIFDTARSEVARTWGGRKPSKQLFNQNTGTTRSFAFDSQYPAPVEDGCAVWRRWSPLRWQLEGTHPNMADTASGSKSSPYIARLTRVSSTMPPTSAMTWGCRFGGISSRISCRALCPNSLPNSNELRGSAG